VSKVEALQQEYERFVRLPWQASLAGPQKVWFVLYAPSEERRLRARLGAFELATKNAGHGWELVDSTDAFAHWMAEQEYRESYFEEPEFLELHLPAFTEALAEKLRGVLQAQGESDVVALLGVGALFGVARVSELLQQVTSAISGRLVVFFPGERDGNSYRLLDARAGWNYLAVPITGREE
jgi:hypothetical protein